MHSVHARNVADCSGTNSEAIRNELTGEDIPAASLPTTPYECYTVPAFESWFLFQGLMLLHVVDGITYGGISLR